MIARGDGSVLYNFAVAVDDADMGITHVIRGDDHLSNTPKQLLVMEALGVEPPRYAHLPLLHGPDGKKLSKRHGAASVQELRDAGYLPAAVRNYLALLGWGTQDDTTIMSTDELIERFDIADVGRASAIFDEQKLRWLNGRFMREMDLGRVHARSSRAIWAASPTSSLRAACEIAQEKAQTLEEVWPLIGVPLRGAADRREGVEEGDVGRRAAAADRGAGGAARGRSLRAGRARGGAGPDSRLSTTSSPASSTSRSGSRSRRTSVSPGIFESLAVLGRERSVERIERAVQRLSTDTDHRTSEVDQRTG